MKDEATPGGWEIDREGRIFYRPDPMTKYVIAEMESGDARFERLILSAPELLKALEEQVSECFDSHCEMCARHEAIISKARGPSQ